MPEARRYLWAAAAVLWAGIIFFASSQRDQPGNLGWLDFPYLDKLIHAVVFGILAALLYRASGRPWVAIALSSIYGASDEWHQLSVAGRSADALDWVADSTGAALAVVFLTRTGARNRKRVE